MATKVNLFPASYSLDPALDPGWLASGRALDPSLSVPSLSSAIVTFLRISGRNLYPHQVWFLNGPSMLSLSLTTDQAK